MGCQGLIMSFAKGHEESLASPCTPELYFMAELVARATAMLMCPTALKVVGQHVLLLWASYYCHVTLVALVRIPLVYSMPIQACSIRGRRSRANRVTVAVV